MSPDYLLFTDGSGHPDGFGGWAALASTADRAHQLTAMGASSVTSVDRMEMIALLEGLQLVSQLQEQCPITQNPFRPRKPVVEWHSDRESLVKSVAGEYARSNAPDLWMRFGYYEERIQILPHFVKIEQGIPEFVLVDLHASTGRIIVKNYLESLQAHAA